MNSLDLIKAVKSPLAYGSSTSTQTPAQLYAQLETLISKIGDIERAKEHLTASNQATAQDIADTEGLLQVLTTQVQKVTQQIVELIGQRMAVMNQNSETRLALLPIPTSSVTQATDLMSLLFYGQAPPTPLLPPVYA